MLSKVIFLISFHGKFFTFLHILWGYISIFWSCSFCAGCRNVCSSWNIYYLPLWPVFHCSEVSFVELLPLKFFFDIAILFERGLRILFNASTEYCQDRFSQMKWTVVVVGVVYWSVKLPVMVSQCMYISTWQDLVRKCKLVSFISTIYALSNISCCKYI